MIVYTYSEARQRLALLLDQVLEQGEVRIKRKDGQVFVIRPGTLGGSPMDVVGADTNLNANEIVACVHEGRRSG